jgi:NADH:ubiquinone oxidoreductase subunit 5 (subunit L)/multisubunit Na+/H+ antiporter MnhA subunit
MSDSLNPAAPHHLPAFITAPGETDVLMVVMAVFLILAVLAVGLLFLRLHTLPERIAHKSHKLQFEIVAVLGLLALFTHMHIFWVAGLLLALIDLPDLGWPLRRMAGSLEKIAGIPPGEGETKVLDETRAAVSGLAKGAGADETDVPKTIIPARMPAPSKTPAIPGKAELIHA